MWSQSCQCFHYFPAQSPSLMSYSEEHSLLAGSMCSAHPAAAGFFQTISLLCLERILEELYLEDSLMSLKKPNKQAFVVSAGWESINIAAKCTDRVNLFLYSASCQTASYYHSEKCTPFQKRQYAMLCLRKREIYPAPRFSDEVFSLSTKFHFP